MVRTAVARAVPTPPELATMLDLVLGVTVVAAAASPPDLR